MATIKLEQLAEFIKAEPGSTAKKVASAFGVSRKEVNSLLYAEKDRIFSKSENNHTWYLLGTKIIESSSSDEPAVTKIARKHISLMRVCHQAAKKSSSSSATATMRGRFLRDL